MTFILASPVVFLGVVIFFLTGNLFFSGDLMWLCPNADKDTFTLMELFKYVKSKH